MADDPTVPAHKRMFYCDTNRCTRHELGRGLYALPEGWSRTISGEVFCPEHSS
jgi:hypothetical protein